MITKALLEEVLAKAMSTGADFAEVFCENTRSNSVYMVGGKVDSITDSTIAGVGIRAFLGVRSVSASTVDMTREGLLRCAEQVADVIGEGSAQIDICLTERIFPDIHGIKLVPDTVKKAQKIDILRAGYQAAKGYHENISQVTATLLDFDHNIMIANSDGLYTEDRQIRTRMAVSAIASRDGENQSGSASPGRRMGLELFDLFSPESIGEEAARHAMVNLSAGYCPAGKMTVAIENGFGGVIFHEACGHSLEATSVAKNTSQMAGKLGQVVANEKVTAIDDGTIPNAWGSINIDDEGTPSQRKILIENGVLKNYMIDKLNGRRMGMKENGSSRRESFRHSPTSRMTNTYIAAGNDKNEDIISSIEYGLYAAKMGGGSVNPISGAFNFAVSEAYIIRNGKICEPVRGASLIGTGSEILKNIDMVGTDMVTGQGMCGSSSGSIRTDVGQPLIRVSEITVGGR
ncbi:MAG: TldD/PmbA family protein [Clostridia bacterium]|nr:TldD/PmbA family protein [Clostridia bacterium]